MYEGRDRLHRCTTSINKKEKTSYCIEKNCKFQVGFRGRVMGAGID